jgi:hypothetical protein
MRISVLKHPLCYIKQDDAASREAFLHQKMLDIVQTAISLQRAWVTKKSVDKGASDFEEAWRALLAFADAQPTVPIKCDYLWGLRLDVLAFS